MTDPGAVAALGIEAVQWLSEGPDTVTVQVSGRWRRRRPSLSGQPLLVIDAHGQRHRFPAMPEPPSLTGTAPGMWRMSFSVPAALVREPGVRAWLQLGATQVPLPQEFQDPHAAAEVVDPATTAESRLLSAELALQGAQARARAAEGAATELASRVNRLEREAQHLQTLLHKRELVRRDSEQRAHAEQMVRLEVAHERDVVHHALERAQARARELARALQALRRRADEAEHAAAAAREDRGGARERRAGARRAALIAGGIVAESARVGRGVREGAMPVGELPTGDLPAAEQLAGDLPPPRPEWSELEREMLAARASAAVRDRAALQERLREAEARCQRAYDAIDELRDQLEVVRLAYDEVGAAPGPVVPDDVAARIGPVERERLEAALSRLREANPPEEEGDEPSAAVDQESPSEELAATAGAPAPEATKPWLTKVFRRLAERDPDCAGQLLIALLPAQGFVHQDPLAYDVVLDSERCLRVTVAEGGVTRVVEADSPRDASDVQFQVFGDAAALARLVAAGVPRRRPLFGRRGLARVSGSRQAARALAALPAARLTLGAVRRGILWFAPALAFSVVAEMIEPAWTRGEEFTIAYRDPATEVAEAGLRVADGVLTALQKAGSLASAATVIVCPDDVLPNVLEGSAGESVAVEGEGMALALVQRWVKRAQSG